MSATTIADESILYHFVFGLDTWLRRWHLIREYSNDPKCIFRIELTQAEHDIRLSDGTMARKGTPIVDLHLWNENLPRMSRGGPSIHWALHMRRCVETSLRELANYVETRSEFRDVALVRGAAMFCSTERCHQMARLCTKFGFEVVAGPRPQNLIERIYRFGQNILISLMVLALNGAAIRADTLRRARVDVYLSRKLLVSRFGAR